MTLLISLSDFADFKHISANINSATKLNPFINEAQEFDLRPLMGAEFFLDLIADFEASPSLATYSDLFNGSEWTVGTIKHQHNGIKPVLAYFSFARYLMNQGANSAPFGMVQKLNNPESQPISERTLERLVSQAKSGAQAYWSRVNKFLLDNKSDYPLYRCPKKPQSGGGLRFISVGGNSKTY